MERIGKYNKNVWEVPNWTYVKSLFSGTSRRQEFQIYVTRRQLLLRTEEIFPETVGRAARKLFYKH